MGAVTKHEAVGLRRAAAMVVGALRDVGKDAAHHQIPGFRSTILWNAGHLAWSIDVVLAGTIGCAPKLPPVYSTCFGFGSNPDPAHYSGPDLAQIAADLTETANRVATFLEGQEDALLDRPLPDGHPLGGVFKTLGELVQTTGFHTGYHAGQIGVLRRVQGMPPALGA